MRFKILIGTIAALPLLTACGSTVGGSGGGGAGGHGGQTTGSTTSAPGDCGGAAASLAGDPCIDGQPSQCGVALWTCTADVECSGDPGTVCRRCDATFGYCESPCTKDADCPGATCDASGRCIPTACTANADCPTNFACGAAEGFCVRKLCAADADCSGHCVSNHCAEHPAYCSDCT
jgi:hypothetical protein